MNWSIRPYSKVDGYDIADLVKEMADEINRLEEENADLKGRLEDALDRLAETEGGE
jgi:hypothetical protein